MIDSLPFRPGGGPGDAGSGQSCDLGGGGGCGGGCIYGAFGPLPTPGMDATGCPGTKNGAALTACFQAVAPPVEA